MPRSEKTKAAQAVVSKVSATTTLDLVQELAVSIVEGTINVAAMLEAA